MQHFPVRFIIPSILAFLGVYYLMLGLRVILMKRPFLLPARHLFWVVMLGLLPGPIAIGQLFYEDPQLYLLSDILIFATLLLIYVIVLIIVWRQMSGYIALGVTDKSFKSVMHTSLEELNLPYKESGSKIELTSIGIEIQASVQSWMGRGGLRVKQSEHREMLNIIAEKMNRHFIDERSEMSRASGILNLIIGTLAIMYVVYLAFIR
jgi:hypothetical protein